MNEQDLFRLKKQVDDAKSTVSELKGHQQALVNQLKNDWDCPTIEDAEKLVKKMEKEITQLSAQIDNGIKELEGKYQI